MDSHEELSGTFVRPCYKEADPAERNKRTQWDLSALYSSAKSQKQTLASVRQTHGH